MNVSRLEEVRRRRPLIHCVSNIVSANDCANLALAVGASPMMAQAPEEMADRHSVKLMGVGMAPRHSTVLENMAEEVARSLTPVRSAGV